MALIEDIVIPSWVNGKEEPTSQTFKVISPNTGNVCWRAVNSSKEDGLRAVEAAKAAFPSWSTTKPAIKQKILLKAADLLEARTEDYGRFMEVEIGADSGVTRFFIIPTAVKMLRDIASQISNVCGSVPVVQDEGTSAMVWKEPYGVVLGIAPWYGSVLCLTNSLLSGLLWLTPRPGTPHMFLAFELPGLLLRRAILPYSKDPSYRPAASGLWAKSLLRQDYLQGS